MIQDSLGVALPVYSKVSEQSIDFTEALPTEYRADLVVQLTGADGPVAGLVVEVQLRRDPQKRYTWPVYAATLRARLQCDAYVLVVTPSERVARWCREPISQGAGSSLRPLVLGPEAIPVVRDPEIARAVPELGVLSVWAHAPHRDAAESAQLAFSALRGLETLDVERGRLYSDIVLWRLNEAARAALEAEMISKGYELQSDWAKGHYARGVEEGRARGVEEGQARGVEEGRARGVEEGREAGVQEGRVMGITEARRADLYEILEARGLSLTEEQRTRISDCVDPDVLKRWIRQAVTADSASAALDRTK